MGLSFFIWVWLFSSCFWHFSLVVLALSAAASGIAICLAAPVWGTGGDSVGVCGTLPLCVLAIRFLEKYHQSHLWFQVLVWLMVAA